MTAALNKQIKSLARSLGASSKRLGKTGNARSALVKHFKSSVMNDVSLVLCGHDLRNMNADAQACTCRAAARDHAYWANVSRRLKDVVSTTYLVTEKGVFCVLDRSQDIDVYADFVLAHAPKQTAVQELTQRIQHHDWTHAMSDDYRAWSAGRHNLDRIRALTKQLGVDVAQPIWDRFAPDGYSLPAV